MGTSGNRHGLRVFLGTMLLVTSLAACGKNGAPAPESTSSPENAAPAPTAETSPPSPSFSKSSPPAAALPEEVEAIVDRLTNDLPPSAEILFARGQILDLYGQSDAAVWCWNACLEHDAKFAQAHERIGLVHLQRGEFDQAASRFRQAGELDPKLPEVRLHLGKALVQLGRIEEAKPILERQTSLYPASVEGWFRLGQAHLETDEFERAKKCFQSALDRYPECLPAWFGMTQACERLGEVEKARECRERFLELEQAQLATERGRRDSGELRQLDDRQPLSQACTIAADIFMMHGLQAEAVSYWRRAAEADAKNVYCRQALGRMLARENRTKEAIEVFEELQALQPQSADPLLALAALHQQLGQAEAAEKSLERAMEIAPQRPDVPAGLARHYLMTGRRLPEAQRLAERVVRMQPTAANYFLLSSLCHANQDRGGAKAALSEAIRLDPQNPQYAAAAGALESE